MNRFIMQEQVLTDLNDNSNIILTVGEKLIIELESNPGTGYEWIPENKSVLHFNDIETDYKSLHETPAPGSAELSLINLIAGQTGEGEIVLHYIKPWHPTEKERTFKVKYIIKEKEIG